ncbi:MAG: phosphoenolpyruvate--protein phosphotransferase [Lentisphaerae bacterium]|jgi:phosphotransferase system enzyme I (PtsI)|nr:phosphoenolpyruvate--protein phosphotransferase [Lentisphaerota bacterium]
MSSDGAMKTLAGIPVARGFASGPVFVFRSDGELPIPEYLIDPGREADELKRLKRAVATVRRDLESLVAVLKQRTGKEDVRVFECHLMLLEDELIQQEIEERIVNGRVNAETAVRKTMDSARSQFEKMNDPYFRERVRDFDDIERRLQKALAGCEHTTHTELKAPSIVVADDLTPSETVQLPREYVLGFATDGGSSTSHVALLARALAIPCVCGLGSVTANVRPGEKMLLDGTNGAVILNPDKSTQERFDILINRQREALEGASSKTPTGKLKDGREILLYANVHPGLPYTGMKELGARGIGLYRSEYLWLDRELEPSEDEQFNAYSEAVIAAREFGKDSVCVIRTLDLGGDKLVKGISSKEANPFLGQRSIRYLLTHRDVFRRQLRAILRASAFGHTAIMYPMISCTEELRDAAVELESVKRELAGEGIKFDENIAVGAMIEVPAAALSADDLARQVDFFSLGTNDLVQYTMAADRGNDSVSYLYQPLNRAVIKLVRMTVEAAKAKGIHVSVCGESASDPVIGTFWVAVGVDTLSMSATYIPGVSHILSRLSSEDLDEYAKVPDSLHPGATGAEIFDACRTWLTNKIPEIEDLIA